MRLTMVKLISSVGQLVENDVDVGAGHAVDLGVDTANLVSQRAFDVVSQRRCCRRAGIDRHGRFFNRR